METKRIELKIPEPLLELIDDYQEKEAILTRTTAILELIRMGLRKDEKVI